MILNKYEIEFILAAMGYYVGSGLIRYQDEPNNLREKLIYFSEEIEQEECDENQD